jgi:uncharacterized glyoxalase superfamily protein PhnB
VEAGLRCEVFSQDLDATASFYVEVLGFELVRDERATDTPYLALVRGRVRVGAAARARVPDRSQRRPPVGVELVLEVDDVDADRARVGAAGWPVAEDLTQRPWGLRDFRLLDPDGYYWRVTTHEP